MVLLFAFFAFSICVDQVSRFVEDPFAITRDVNYHEWTYSPVGFTICTDYVNESFIGEYYQRYENTTFIDYKSKRYRDYRYYMELIGALNADNIHSIDRFENTELFRNLNGEEIFKIALNV